MVGGDFLLSALHLLPYPHSVYRVGGGREGAPQKADFIFHQSWRWDTQLILGGKKKQKNKKNVVFLVPARLLGLFK